MPRNIAGSIVRGGDFWGRDREVGSVWRLLERGDVLLLAPRRHGKSSLMRALYDDPQPGWTVVHLDVEYVSSGPEFATVLAAALLHDEHTRPGVLQRAGATLRRWVGAIEELAVAAPAMGDLRVRLRQDWPEGTDWMALAEGLLLAVHAQRGDTLLILDELPMMVENLLEGAETDGIRFLQWFRAQRQRVEGVRFLVGGSINLEPILHRLDQTALLNDLQRFRLRGFGLSEAITFTGLVFRTEGCAVEDGVPEAVVRALDSTTPFLLQVLIEELRRESEDRGRAVTVADVERVYRERVVGPDNRHRFGHYESRLRGYGELESPARWVLEQLGPDGGNHAALRAELLATWKVQPEAVLARLEADYYLVLDGPIVRFSSAFLRDWWVRNASRSGR